MKRRNPETGQWENAELDPTTGTWKTNERNTSPYYQYGLFPLIREMWRGTRKVKWVGFSRGLDAALYYDEGTDFLS